MSVSRPRPLFSKSVALGGQLQFFTVRVCAEYLCYVALVKYESDRWQKSIHALTGSAPTGLPPSQRSPARAGRWGVQLLGAIVNSHAKSYPWRKLFVADYLADQRILLVSLAARGLLADIEALAYTGDEPGRLVLSGRAMSATEIARLRGIHPDEIEKPLAELLSAGLIERDAQGIIIASALVPELKGRTGARTRKQRQRQREEQGNSKVTPHVTPHVTGQSRVRAESESEQSQNTPGANGVGVEEAFSELKRMYPKKDDDPEAFKEWQQLCRDTNPEDLLALCRAALSWQTRSKNWRKEGGQYIPELVNYLKRRKFNSEPTGGKRDDGRHAAGFDDSRHAKGF